MAKIKSEVEITVDVTLEKDGLGALVHSLTLKLHLKCFVSAMTSL